MADITMCEGVGCESKLTCYRFTAPQNKYRQTYFKETPIVKTKGLSDGCEYYWNNKEYERNYID